MCGYSGVSRHTIVNICYLTPGVLVFLALDAADACLFAYTRMVLCLQDEETSPL